MTDRTGVLLSYHYFRQHDLDATLDKYFGPWRPYVDLFLDSGAFSALTLGAAINVHEYGRFAAQHRDHYTVLANLDVIDHGPAAAEQTWVNQRTLEDTYGLSPLPVVHLGSPPEVLWRYLDAGYTYIALGGLVRKSWRDVAPWVVRCFKDVQGKAVLHGFGVSSEPALWSLPWYTTDATSWQSSLVFGRLGLWTGREFKAFYVGESVNTAASREFNQLIRSYGFDPATMRRAKDNLGPMAQCASLSLLRYEQWLRRRHGTIEQPGNPDAAPGLRIYLASSNLRLLSHAVQARHPHPQENP